MTVLELARQFREAVINIVSKEGQPGTLGTAGGTVFYNDGVNDHLDRVWVRMGAENQVLVVANARKAGLPAIAGLEVTVVKRHGSLYIDDWERNDAAAHAHDYDTRNVITGKTSSVLGSDNTMMGYLAGGSLLSGGVGNTLLGSFAGQNITTGDNNIFVGRSAGGSTTGGENIAIGFNAGSGLTDGANNVVIGNSAGDDITTGGRNTVIGYNAGSSSADERNTYLGYAAGLNVVGSYNTFIGYAAGASLSGNDYCVFLGYQAGAYMPSARDYSLWIDVGTATKPLIYGEFDDDNIGLCRMRDMGGGEGVIAIGDASTVPDSNPTGGGILYVESGALKYRGSSGTITVLGVA